MQHQESTPSDEDSAVPGHESAPSLDLAFQWVKQIPGDQVQLAETYNTRIVALFSMSSVILGIGLPVGLDMVQPQQLGWTASLGLGVAAIACYLIAVAVTVLGLWPRNFFRLDDAVKIRKEFAGLPQDTFKREMLRHVEDAYKSNRRPLKWKARSVFWAVILLPVQTITLVLALVLALG